MHQTSELIAEGTVMGKTYVSAHDFIASKTITFTSEPYPKLHHENKMVTIIGGL